jgi:hypothetical protein
MGLDVQLKVSQIKDTTKEFQGNLAQQYQELTQVLSPLDTTTIMETLVKLRDALKDATYENAYLVMQNNELYRHNSFMTPAQKAAIKKAQAEQTTIYGQQRENPHYIITVGQGKVATFKSRMSKSHSAPSTDEILREVDEVIKNKGKRAAPTAQLSTPVTTRGKGKKSLEDFPRPGNTKHPRTQASESSGKEEKPPDGPIGTKTFRNALLNNTHDGPYYGQSQNKGTFKGKGKRGKPPNNMGSRYYVHPSPN